jgi:hypothetical protein
MLNNNKKENNDLLQKLEFKIIIWKSSIDGMVGSYYKVKDLAN